MGAEEQAGVVADGDADRAAERLRAVEVDDGGLVAAAYDAGAGGVEFHGGEAAIGHAGGGFGGGPAFIP